MTQFPWNFNAHNTSSSELVFQLGHLRMPSVPSLLPCAGGRMARFPVLLVTFGMGIFSYNTRYGGEVVAEIPTLTCPSLNSGINSSCSLWTTRQSAPFPASIFSSQSRLEMIRRRCKHGLIFNGLRAKGFYERILAFGFVSLSHPSPN